jgi:hypothetical protein
MAVVDVVAGVCGMNTQIIAQADDAFGVTLEITSDCAHIRKLAELLPEIAALEELRLPLNETSPYRLAAQCRVHNACPVPSAILKAVEVATEMALPADVHIHVRKD